MSTELITQMNPLYAVGYNIDDTLYICYNSVMDIMGLSTHFHQYNKRKAKYPTKVLRINGKPHISEHYALALIKYHNGLRAINSLKQEGGTL